MSNLPRENTLRTESHGVGRMKIGLFFVFENAKCNVIFNIYIETVSFLNIHIKVINWGYMNQFLYQHKCISLYFYYIFMIINPRGDAGGLSREYVLRIPSVS